LTILLLLASGLQGTAYFKSAVKYRKNLEVAPFASSLRISLQ